MWHDLANFVRGLLMGAADVIPGVSGGTVALIVGIYERLVLSISHFDRHFLQLLANRQWRAALARIDLRFLVSLGLGIGVGAVLLGSSMERLLTGPLSRPATLAAFFGMILGSTYVVSRMVGAETPGDRMATVIAAVSGGTLAFWLTGLPQGQAEITPAYVFLCGMIGICAMILPGISGAYLLLILGFYPHLTEILHDLPRGKFTTQDLVTVVVFASGCLIGLLAFSKILRWLLENYKSLTLAVLCGFMIGALRKIWPFQEDLTPNVDKLKLKEFRNVLPESVDRTVLICLGIALLAMVIVILLERTMVLNKSGVTNESVRETA